MYWSWHKLIGIKSQGHRSRQKVGGLCYMIVYRGILCVLTDHCSNRFPLWRHQLWANVERCALQCGRGNASACSCGRGKTVGLTSILYQGQCFYFENRYYRKEKIFHGKNQHSCTGAQGEVGAYFPSEATKVTCGYNGESVVHGQCDVRRMVTFPATYSNATATTTTTILWPLYRSTSVSQDL